MTRAEAVTLVGLIVGTWPLGGIDPNIWVNALVPLQRERATAAYEQLRDIDATMPSIARFIDTYRARDRAATRIELPDPPSEAERARIKALRELPWRERAKAWEALDA